MTSTPQAHSTVGASSMYRWSACPGSVRLSEGIPNKSSVYAEEGSDAHALGAVCLAEGDDAADYIGTSQDIDGRKFIVNAEMAEAVQVYLDAVRETIATDPAAEFHVEQRFDLSEVYPGCFGTSDAVIWLPGTKTLVVMDYKHGAGIPVRPENNPQLQYYGLGALLASKYPAATVRLVIVQPRCGDEPVRSWEIDAVDLIDFRADLKMYAEATAKLDAPLVAGGHCHFCPAAAICPALSQKAQDMARLDFAPTLSYDPEKLRLALESREPLKAWLKALDEFAYAEAEAGRCPPGFKLVEKQGRRKWRSEGDAIEFLQKEGFKDDEIFEPRTLKGFTELEKLPGLKPKTVNKQKVRPLDPYTVTESSGHVLVPESDKRPAVKTDAKSDFSALPGSEDLLAIPAFLQRPQKQPSIFDD